MRVEPQVEPERWPDPAWKGSPPTQKIDGALVPSSDNVVDESLSPPHPDARQPTPPRPTSNLSGVSTMGTMRTKLESNSSVMISYLYQLTIMTSVPGTKAICDVSLHNLTRADTITIAGGMLYFLKQEASEDDAMEKFIEAFPSMKEVRKGSAFTKTPCDPNLSYSLRRCRHS